jgi:hypothetical protein
LISGRLGQRELLPWRGAAIALGRELTDEDDRLGASAAIISYRFWMSAFGALRSD